MQSSSNTRERVVAAVGERTHEQELAARDEEEDRGGSDQPPAALEHPEPDPREEDRQQEERERARGDRQDGEEAEQPAPPGLERDQTPAGRARIPSANGKAAEMTSSDQTTANVRLDQRASGPNCLQTTIANASAAIPIERTASALIPNTAASG